MFCGLAVILLRERRKLRNANRRLKEESLNSEGDAEQIDQILLNLVTNAAQAMNDVQGTLLIRTGGDFLPDVSVDIPTFGNRRTGGEFVWFEVIDSGKGIAESDLRSIRRLIVFCLT